MVLLFIFDILGQINPDHIIAAIIALVGVVWFLLLFVKVLGIIYKANHESEKESELKHPEKETDNNNGE